MWLLGQGKFNICKFYSYLITLLCLCVHTYVFSDMMSLCHCLSVCLCAIDQVGGLETFFHLVWP